MIVDDILFRGYNKQTRKWYYGNFVKDFDWNGNRQYLICSIPESPDDEVIFMDVDPETVGQYVGRNDIDNNMIFTDDLIECYWRYHFGEEDKFRDIYCVVTDSCIDNGLGYCWPQDTLDCRVIGNKYDNPDIYEQMRENARKEAEEYWAKKRK